MQNNLLIILQTSSVVNQNINNISGLLDDPTNWIWWGYLVVALIFTTLSAFFIWLYFSCKKTADSLLARAESHSSWSYIGFWGRYRGAILAFMVAVFLLLAVAFLVFSLTGNIADPNIGV